MITIDNAVIVKLWLQGIKNKRVETVDVTLDTTGDDLIEFADHVYGEDEPFDVIKYESGYFDYDDLGEILYYKDFYLLTEVIELLISKARQHHVSAEYIMKQSDMIFDSISFILGEHTNISDWRGVK